MADRRRQLYLEQTIAKLQEDKLAALKNSREVRGSEKAAILDNFLMLNEQQGKLESELEDLLEED